MEKLYVVIKSQLQFDGTWLIKNKYLQIIQIFYISTITFLYKTLVYFQLVEEGIQ